MIILAAFSETVFSVKGGFCFSKKTVIRAKYRFDDADEVTFRHKTTRTQIQIDVF